MQHSKAYLRLSNHSDNKHVAAEQQDQHDLLVTVREHCVLVPGSVQTTSVFPSIIGVLSSMALSEPVQAASKQRVHDDVMLPNICLSLGMHQVYTCNQSPFLFVQSTEWSYGP